MGIGSASTTKKFAKENCPVSWFQNLICKYIPSFKVTDKMFFYNEKNRVLKSNPLKKKKLIQIICQFTTLSLRRNNKPELFMQEVGMQSRVNILTPKHDNFFECCCKRRGGGKKQMISPKKIIHSELTI